MRQGRSPEPPTVAATRAAVLYLINQYPAVTHTFIKREVLALERLGVEVMRVAARPGKELVDPGDIEERERTFYLLHRPLGLIYAAGLFLILRPRGFIRSLVMSLRMMRRSDRGPIVHVLYLLEACRVASLVRATRATHIHAHFGTNPAEVAMLASELSGATYSFTVHGYDEYDKPEFLGLRAKIRRAAFVAAVSHYGRSQLYRWCDGVDRGKIKLIRCGIEQQFKQIAGDAPCEAARFVCVGRLCREKGQDILIKAAALMAASGHKFEITMIGDGEARAELEGLIGTLRLAEIVHLRGWMSSEDVRREMIDARALVVASLAENLPVVIMEAMALRRTVVATQIAGISELVIPHETGWLVPAGSVGALASAMTECLSTSREELQALGRRGRELVLKQHNIDREAAALADLFPTEACRQQYALRRSQPLSTAV
ncbi:glycosyltransferase [Bradyrhizobium sp. CB1650]|uniref:glycosyltransferase n=1 Tax=Bradyrhizobium sp. CB1650 TaxID=3039153 RepID=UPI0024349C30|nr:glycosyltransferase [Bradyrhizobium sp. CB1650]WGD54941.1 glycosyltransferase [Bradyrhizobium sp. CB1650]